MKFPTKCIFSSFNRERELISVQTSSPTPFVYTYRLHSDARPLPQQAYPGLSSRSGISFVPFPWRILCCTKCGKKHTSRVRGLSDLGITVKTTPSKFASNSALQWKCVLQKWSNHGEYHVCNHVALTPSPKSCILSAAIDNYLVLYAYCFTLKLSLGKNQDICSIHSSIWLVDKHLTS